MLFGGIKVVHSEGAWTDYLAAVGPLAERFGGRYLVRDATSRRDCTQLDRTSPSLMKQRGNESDRYQ